MTSAAVYALLAGSALAASNANEATTAPTARDVRAARLADIHAQLAAIEAEMAQLRSSIAEWQMLAEHTGSDRYGPAIAAALRELAELRAEYAGLLRSALTLQQAPSVAGHSRSAHRPAARAR